MKGVGRDMAKFLNDFQFGVKISRSVKTILDSGNRVLTLQHEDDSLPMLTVDFLNAFNMVDRSTLLQEVRVRCLFISLRVKFLYGQTTSLYNGDKHIMVANEVQQSDLLGLFLFALVLHLLIHKIIDN
jgi:hypothetical protein